MPDWTPDKPMANAEDEADCDREAQARARVDWLRKNKYKTDETPAPKTKRKGIFSDRD